LAVAAACIAANWLPPKTAKDDFDLSRFGEIPVLVGGRIKPLDTVARNSLLIIHGKQNCDSKMARGLKCDAMAHRCPVQCSCCRSIPGVLSCKTQRSSACSAGNKATGSIFSFAEFAPFLKQIDEQAAQSDKLEESSAPPIKSAILNLRNGLSLYQRLKNSIQPEGAENFTAELQSFASSVPAAATQRANARWAKIRQSEPR